MRLVCSCAIISFVWSELTQALNFRRCLPVLASWSKQSLRQHNSYSAFFSILNLMRTCLRLITRVGRTKNSRVSVCIQYVEIVHLSISGKFRFLLILKCACVSFCVCVWVVSLHSVCEIAVAFSSAFSFASHGWAKKYSSLLRRLWNNVLNFKFWRQL